MQVYIKLDSIIIYVIIFRGFAFSLEMLLSFLNRAGYRYLLDYLLIDDIRYMTIMIENLNDKRTIT